MNNPFADCGSIIYGERFIGRKKAISTIENRMLGKNYGNLAIIGMNKVGKASLAYHSFIYAQDKLLEEHIIPCWVEMPTYDNTTRFYTDLINKLHDEICEIDELWGNESKQKKFENIKKSVIEASEPMEHRQYIQRYLRSLHRYKYRVIFILNDFDKTTNFFKFPDFQFMRELSYNPKYGLRWLIIANKTIEEIEKEQKSISNFYQTFENLYLGLYNADDLMAYWQYFERETKIILSENDKSDVQKYAGNHPYLLDFVCNKICVEYQAKNKLDFHFLEEDLKLDLYEKYENIISFFENINLGKDIWKLLFGNKNEVPLKSINHLLQYGVIYKAKNDDYTCFSSFFTEYLKNNNQTEEEKFIENEESVELESYINNINIKNFFCIEDMEIKDLGDKKEIYFLGENGDGKTLLLQAIIIAATWHHINETADKEVVGTITKLLQSCENYNKEQNDNQKLLLEIQDASEPKQTYKYKASKTSLPHIYAYGTHRSRSTADTDSDKDYDKYGYMTLFSNNSTTYRLRRPEHWLKELYLIEMQNKENASKQAINFEQISFIISDMLGKTVNDIQNMHLEPHYNETAAKVEDKLRILFVERGTKLEFEQLSDGYKSVITWLTDLLTRLAETQSEAKQLSEYKGTVIVDELGLYLHPKWERNIATKLRNIFPNIQFIFTTHSPILILGASDDAAFFRLYKSRKEETNKYITQISGRFDAVEMRHLMGNTVITSPLFGLDDARMRALKNNEVPDTSDTYLHTRIYKRIENQLEKHIKEQAYISPEEIDKLVDDIFDEDFDSLFEETEDE